MKPPSTLHQWSFTEKEDQRQFVSAYEAFEVTIRSIEKKYKELLESIFVEIYKAKHDCKFSVFIDKALIPSEVIRYLKTQYDFEIWNTPKDDKYEISWYNAVVKTKNKQG